MDTLLPAPEHVARQLSADVASRITCVRDGDQLVLDTPFLLQDGHLLRAYISVGDEMGHLLVSDGAWAAEQVQLFTAGASLDARWKAMAQVARECGVEFDTEFRYRAIDLSTAVAGLDQLARAVDRTLTILAPTGFRTRTTLRTGLRDDMRHAGLHVESRPLIRVGSLEVRVDYRVSSGPSEAAVELLSGQTPGGAMQSVNQAVTNFHLLHGKDYRGMLAAIFDENSAAATTSARRRLTEASPPNTLLIPSSEAPETLRRRLAA